MPHGHSFLKSQVVHMKYMINIDTSFKALFNQVDSLDVL